MWSGFWGPKAPRLLWGSDLETAPSTAMGGGSRGSSEEAGLPFDARLLSIDLTPRTNRVVVVRALVRFVWDIDFPFIAPSRQICVCVYIYLYSTLVVGLVGHRPSLVSVPHSPSFLDTFDATSIIDLAKIAGFRGPRHIEMACERAWECHCELRPHRLDRCSSKGSAEPPMERRPQRQRGRRPWDQRSPWGRRSRP